MLFLKRKDKTFTFFMIQNKPLIDGFGIKVSEDFSNSVTFFQRKISDFLRLILKVFPDYKIKKLILVHENNEIHVFERVRAPYSRWTKTK